MTTSHPPNADDLLYAHHAAPEMAASVAAHAKQFEDQVLMHVSEAYKYWTRLPPSNRDHCWKLEMARNVGGKTQKIQQLENMLRGVQQENAHLKCQIESLSKLQAPREYAMSRPETIKIGPQEASKLAGMGLREQSMGWKMGRVEESLEERVRNAVERWRGVVKASRRSGLPGQRSLSQGQQSMESGMMQQNHGDEEESMDVDADADADADAEADEDNNVAVQYTFKPEMPTPNPNSQQMQQQAQQQQQHAQQQQQVPQHAQHNRGHEVNQQQQQQQQQAHMITGVNYGQANMHQQRHNANQQHVAMNGLGIGVASVGLMHQNYPQHAQQQQQAMSHQGQGMEGGQVSINGRSMSSGMSQPMAQMSMGRGGMGMQQQQQGQVGQMNGRGARNGF